MDRAEEMAELFRGGQQRLVAAFEEFDGTGRFAVSPWERSHLGAGRACVLERGGVFERAGVNVSLVHGERVPPAILEAHPDTDGLPFSATGISLVLHPLNPYAPSFHANFRFFGVGDTWWFGGGCDLTPMYGFEADAVHFHRTLKEWCERHVPLADHAAWKKACDEYFTIQHRAEMRGIGGVFFDHLAGDFDQCRALVVDGVETILPSYLPVLRRRVTTPYGDRQRQWQLLRRGRYAEFNLVYDRGTRFGLQTRGNIEAILMSMPPMAGWGFDVRPEPGSAEDEVKRFLQPRDWA
jgi:coproporphyrinogen III oxidase